MFKKYIFIFEKNFFNYKEPFVRKVLWMEQYSPKLFFYSILFKTIIFNNFLYF